MSPDELFKAAQDAATQVRSEMEQVPQPSAVLALLHEQIGLTVYHQSKSQERGNAVLVLAAQMAEQRAESVSPDQEAPVIPGRPPGGVFIHEPPAPGESAQEKAEAEFAAAEAQRAAEIAQEAAQETQRPRKRSRPSRRADR